MNWVDLFIFIVILVTVINGARRGLFRELLALGSIIAALIVSINYCDWFAVGIAGIINFPPHLMFAVSFLSLFIIALVGAKLIGLMLFKMVDPAKLKGTDKFGGGIAGGVRGVFILGVIFTMFLFLPVLSKYNTTVDESALAPSIRQFVPKLYDYTAVIHPLNPSFTSKVRSVLVPVDDSGIEIAKKEGEKTLKTTGDGVMQNVERYFGDNDPNRRNR
ncbi:MAG: CvpA family protein [candidate division Zixibacteria bacterium]|nr:CvpA family protein [candidate division Zixibacteria bacterium]